MERDFKGIWISKEIWLDTRMNAVEKIILAEIDSLDIENKGCYASNDYLAEFTQCSVTKVSLAIKKLIELGYIELESFNGRTRILKSRLSKNERQTYILLNADSQNVKDNNKSNNINNNKDDKESKEKELFDEFWKAYPRKVDKQGSFKAYRNIPHLEQEHPIILNAIETLKHSMQWQDIRFIPHPTTFIHQRRWEDVEENESPFPKSYDEPQEHSTDEEIEKWYWDNYQEKVKVKNGRVIEWGN